MAVDGLGGKVAELVVGHGFARGADDAGTIRQLALLVAVEQGGQQLALGQVAGGAENHEIEVIDGNDAGCHAVPFCLQGSCVKHLRYVPQGLWTVPIRGFDDEGNKSCGSDLLPFENCMARVCGKTVGANNDFMLRRSPD